MKNSGGSLGFNGQDNSDKPHKMLKQYDYNHSGLTPKATGTRTNLKGNSVALGKPSPMGDTAGNDHGPISGTAHPQNWKGAKTVDKHVDTNFVGKRGPQVGNKQ